MVVWIVGQAAVVAGYAARVHWSAGYPEPVEASADLGLACGQLVLAALTGPDVFGRPVRAAAVGLVFVILAARLADRTFADTLRVLTTTALWCGGLARLGRSPAGRTTAAFLTIAGPVLFYVRLEYGPSAVPLGSWPTLVSPTLGVCTTRLQKALWRPLVAPALLVLFTLLPRKRGKNALSLRSLPLQ